MKSLLIYYVKNEMSKVDDLWEGLSDDEPSIDNKVPP
jgi:hypothetical protein